MDTRSRCQEWSRERTWSLLARKDMSQAALDVELQCKCEYWVGNDEDVTPCATRINSITYLTSGKIFQLTIWILKAILLSLDTLLHNLHCIPISYSRLKRSMTILPSQMQKIAFLSSDLWTRRWKFLTKWKYPGHQNKRSWKRKDYLRI